MRLNRVLPAMQQASWVSGQTGCLLGSGLGPQAGDQQIQVACTAPGQAANGSEVPSSCRQLLLSSLLSWRKLQQGRWPWLQSTQGQLHMMQAWGVNMSHQRKRALGMRMHQSQVRLHRSERAHLAQLEG